MPRLARLGAAAGGPAEGHRGGGIAGGLRCRSTGPWPGPWRTWPGRPAGPGAPGPSPSRGGASRTVCCSRPRWRRCEAAGCDRSGLRPCPATTAGSPWGRRGPCGDDLSHGPAHSGREGHGCHGWGMENARFDSVTLRRTSESGFWEKYPNVPSCLTEYRFHAPESLSPAVNRSLSQRLPSCPASRNSGP